MDGTLVTRWIAIVALVMAVISAALPSEVSAQGGGNSANAHLCKQGGWRALAPGGESIGFASQDECVEFGAIGGEIAALTGIVIPAGSTVTFTGSFGGWNQMSGSYWPSGDGSGSLGYHQGVINGEAPGTPIDLVVYFAAGVSLTISLTDISCGYTYGSNGNHALVTPIAGGYQVDIMDSGECWSGGDPRYPESAGGGNLSVSVILD